MRHAETITTICDLRNQPELNLLCSKSIPITVDIPGSAKLVNYNTYIPYREMFGDWDGMVNAYRQSPCVGEREEPKPYYFIKIPDSSPYFSTLVNSTIPRFPEHEMGLMKKWTPPSKRRKRSTRVSNNW